MLCFCNGKELHVGATNVCTPPYNAYTPCYYVQSVRNHTEALCFRIVYDEPVQSACIRPLSKNISCTIDGNTLSFTVGEPCTLSVEINDTLDKALMVFVVSARQPDFSSYKHVIRYTSGVHVADHISITENDTAIWLEEGAVVHGKWHFQNVENLYIGGPGVCTMELYSRGAGGNPLTLFEMDNCRHVQVTDVCLFDSCNWTFKLSGCEDVEIDGVKIIGCRGNSDGIDVCGSRRVHVQNCFIRSFDDCFVVKAFDTGDVLDLLFEKSVLWNDMARPIEVGVELRCDKVNNVVFRDIDVIHNLTCYPIFGIHHGDRAHLSNIHFEDIRIEHGPGSQLFDFRITDSVWNEDDKKGSIDGIYIDNIRLIGKEGRDFRSLFARVEGFSEDVRVDNVHIGSIYAYGSDVTGALQMERGKYASPILYDHVQPSDKGVAAHLEVIEPFALHEKDRLYHGVVRLTLENGTDTVFHSQCGICVFPKYTSVCDEEMFEVSLAPGEKFTKEYDVQTTAGKRVIESRTERIVCKNDMVYLSLPYLLTKENPQILHFSDCFGKEYGDVTLTYANGWIEMRSALLCRYGVRLYSALPVEKSENEILFAAEESFFGEAPCVKWKNNAIHAAPEIGNHMEITYVFQNQPKTKIRRTNLETHPCGIARFPLATLGLPEETKRFWLEIELLNRRHRHMPDTLFRSTLPSETAHMFAECVICE